MRKIIEGKMYDTRTARKVGEWDNGLGMRDIYHAEEALYRKKTGEYFLHGIGGAGSGWSRQEGNTWTSGEKIAPLTFEEAREWAERKLTAEEYEQLFEVVEDGGSEGVYIGGVSTGAAQRLRLIAQREGKSLAQVLAELVEGK